MNLAAHRRDTFPLVTRHLFSQASARLLMAVPDAIRLDRFRLAARALAKPLRVSAPVISLVVFNLP
jgi:hypothetical protein